MKTTFLIISLSLLPIAVVQAQEISSESKAPASANISQPDFFDGPLDDDGAQTRFRTGKKFPDGVDFRSVVQTFTWSGGRLREVGLMVSPDQNKRDDMTFDNPQHYMLDVQRLKSSKAPIVIETVASVEAVIFPKHVKPGRYLCIKLAEPLSLAKGAAYGLHFRPVDAKAPDNRILFACAAPADVSPDGGKMVFDQHPNVGSGTQHAAQGEVPAGMRYPRRNNCLTFYTTSDKSGGTGEQSAH
jgi:hypothetical protein